MNLDLPSRTRLGILMLALGPLLFFLGIAVRGFPAVDIRDPAFTPQLFAERVSQDQYLLGWIMLLLGTIVLLLGYIALYSYLSRTHVSGTAFIGMVLVIVGGALQLALFGIFTFVYAAIADMVLEGNPTSVDVISRALTGPALPVVTMSALVYVAGVFLIGISVWRSGLLPKWTAIPIFLYQFFFLSPSFGFGDMALFIELTGAALLLASTVVIASNVRRDLSAPAADRVLAPR